MGRLPKLNFIVFGGDQIQPGPNARESLTVFQTWLEQISVPSYILLGNAEVSPPPGSKPGETTTSGHGAAGDPVPAGHRGPSIRAGRTVHRLRRHRGRKALRRGAPAGLRWLERELAANRDKRLIIIALHHLLLPTTPQDLTPRWALWMVKNHAAVRGLLDRFPNVRLVISGHHHASHVETVGRITYVADPAIVTYPCAFRVFTIGREGIHLQNIGLDDKTLVSRARELLIADPFAGM